MQGVQRLDEQLFSSQVENQSIVVTIHQHLNLTNSFWKKLSHSQQHRHLHILVYACLHG